MSDLTKQEQLLAALMLHEAGGEAFLEIARRVLRERQAELGIGWLGDLSPAYRHQLLAQAMEEAALTLVPDLDAERVEMFVSMAKMAWEMDAKATVEVKSDDPTN
ncbi:hypothetical protein BH10PSE1_BH10PSE1_24380 [soil metagenome]